MKYICSKVAPVWCQDRVSCSHQFKTSFRVDPIFGEIVSMSRPGKVSKGYRKNPDRPTEIASCLHNYLRNYLLVRLIDGCTRAILGNIRQHSPANGLTNRVGLSSVRRTVVGIWRMLVKHGYSQANHQRRHRHSSQYPSTSVALAPFSD